MVELTFRSRVEHFVSLSLIKRIASSTSDEPEESYASIGKEGVKAIKGKPIAQCVPRLLMLLEMALVNRGRLSVQPVEAEAWTAVQLLSKIERVQEAPGDKPAKSKRKAKGQFGPSHRGINYFLFSTIS